MFCPSCGSEYVEGVTTCPDCRTALVGQLPTFEDSGESLRMVRVTGPQEAPMIEELLGNNGVDVILQGEHSASELPAMGDLNEVRVWVRESQADAARDIIDAFFGDGSGATDEDDPEADEEEEAEGA